MPPPRKSTIFENGSEPEYTIDDFARVEFLRDGSVRIHVASEWMGGLRVEFSVRVGKAKLDQLGRRCQTIASEAHASGELDTAALTAH